MLLLAVETSCDETSASVLRKGEILSNFVSSQVALHEQYGGVVPELATRAHLENLEPVIRAALNKAEVEAKALDVLAVTRGPGLPSALMSGLKTIQAMAYGLGKPYYAVHHHEAHLYSPWIAGDPLRIDEERIEPSISLIVSGGHTLLVHVKSPFVFEVIGGTVDDAAGECFDKAAKLMGLGYPGGPLIERYAKEGNPERISLPKPKLHDPDFDFSFSGLKTALRYYLRDHPECLKNPQAARNLCASVQTSIIDVLVTKALRAAVERGVHWITLSGGVACNRALRSELSERATAKGIQVRFAPHELSTDNAAMVGAVASRMAQAGITPSDLSLEPLPGWPLSDWAKASWRTSDHEGLVDRITK